MLLFLFLASCASTKEGRKTGPVHDDGARQDFVFHEASRQAVLGNYDAASDLYRHSLSLDSTSAASMYGLAQLYMSLGDRRALQSFAPITDSLLAGAVRLEPDNYWYRRLYAVNLQRMNRTDDAVAQYEELASRFPGNTELLLTLAGLYDRMGEYGKELRVLTRYGRIEDVADELRMQRVACYLELGELDSAYLESDDPDRILEILTESANDMLGRIETDMDRMRCRSMIDMVSDFSDVAIKYNPGLMQAWKSKSTTQVWYGERDKALETIDKGLAQVGDSLGKAALFNMRAEFHHLWGNQTMVYEDYDSVLAYSPLDVMAMNNYAYYLSLEDRDLNRALEMSHKTIEADPLNATYLDTYAWILFRMGRYKDALQYLEKALQYLEEENADIYEHYGDCLFKCGDKEAALENWHRAFQLNSDSPLLERKIKEENYIE